LKHEDLAALDRFHDGERWRVDPAQPERIGSTIITWPRRKSHDLRSLAGVPAVDDLTPA
jgi:hypothetical protein